MRGMHVFISSKLYTATLCEWESKGVSAQELPTIKDLKDYLQERCSMLDALVENKVTWQSKQTMKSDNSENRKNMFSNSPIKFHFM
jgi:hypothetical protein